MVPGWLDYEFKNERLFVNVLGCCSGSVASLMNSLKRRWAGSDTICWTCVLYTHPSCFCSLASLCLYIYLAALVRWGQNQLSSIDPISKWVWYMVGARKCKNELPRKWVGLEQSFLYPSADSFSQTPNHNCFPNFMWATVHQKLGSVNLNEPHTTRFSTMFWTKENTGTQQTGLTKVKIWEALWKARRTSNCYSLSFFVPLRSQAHSTTSWTKQIEVLSFTAGHKLS